MAALDAFEASDWGRKYPAIAQSWRRAWAEVIPFYGFAEDVRRIIYTTNAIEALNAKLRRAVRARGHFPNDDAATKLLFLVLNRAEKEWTTVGADHPVFDVHAHGSSLGNLQDTLRRRFRFNIS